MSSSCVLDTMLSAGNTKINTLRACSQAICNSSREKWKRGPHCVRAVIMEPCTTCYGGREAGALV